MAKAPTSDAIMPADKMRPLLALSKKEPVQAAMGLSSDGDGLLLLDKKASPRKVAAMLRAGADKAKLKLASSSLRFGRAEVDTDHDPGVVRLFVNKEPPGALRLKLTEIVKRISYQKVEFTIDPSLEEGAEDGEPAAEDGAEKPQGAAAAAPDTASLTQQLRELIGRISEAAGADPARKAALTKLAMEAGGDVKAGKLDVAAETIARLRAALDTGTDAAARSADAAAGGLDGTVAYGKARLTWLSTRRGIAGDIERLARAVQADYADEGLGGTIEAEFRAKVEPIMAHFDESLADTLDDAINQTDPARRAKLVADARLIVSRYQTYLASETLIAVLDANPYEPVAIASTLTRTLSALSAAIR